jgi:hypothetical protein
MKPHWTRAEKLFQIGCYIAFALALLGMTCFYIWVERRTGLRISIFL